MAYISYVIWYVGPCNQNVRSLCLRRGLLSALEVLARNLGEGAVEASTTAVQLFAMYVAPGPVLDLFLGCNIYIYIFTHTYVYMYIHV